ncbi:hypothetical protein ABRY23_12835 [Melioribacteraceae bacterium 4301-Me]|uniref:hypothetical protein n=1 Tax=Pyranulibacter aquaticus TaxID=3163344 RepID=UPI003598E705
MRFQSKSLGLFVLVFFCYLTLFAQLSIKFDLKIIQSQKAIKLNLINPSVLTCSVDKKIFIVDSGDSQIKEYGNNFNYIRAFSGKGEGPGELSGKVFLIAANGNGIIVVVDILKYNFIVFTQDGKYQNSFKIEQNDFFPESIVLDSNNNIYFLTSSKLFKYTDKGKKILAVTVKSKKSKENFYYMYQKYMTIYDNKYLYIFFNDEYKIEKRDLQGNLVSSFIDPTFERIPYQPEEFINKQHELAVKSSPVKIYPNIASNIITYKDYLLIILKPRAKWKFKKRVDVFDLVNEKLVARLEDEKFDLLNNCTIEQNTVYSLQEKSDDWYLIKSVLSIK